MGVVNCPVCSISDLTATAQACQEDGTFDVVIDFNVANQGNNGFTIEGNGTNYGTFQYANLPITISDLVGDNVTDYEFIVTDVDLSSCNASTNLGVVNCPVCSISDLTATAQACQEDGTFDIIIDFNVANQGNNGFTIEGNGTNYGTFQYANLPITISDLVGDNATSYEFVVTDVDLSNCSASTNLGVIDCPVCSISNLTATAQACQEDGIFDVVIDFNVANQGNNGFTIEGNGTNYGTFQYANLPITISDLVGDNATDYEFIFTDVDLSSCNAATNLGVVNCPVCSISDLTATAQACQEDGTFDVLIDFNVANQGNNGFAIAGNGTDYGTFQYADLPIMLSDLAGDNSTRL